MRLPSAHLKTTETAVVAYAYAVDHEEADDDGRPIEFRPSSPSFPQRAAGRTGCPCASDILVI
jgi:hypothetical protein